MGSSRPKADRTNLGQWQQMTRETHPRHFRAPGTAAQTAAQARAALDNMIRRITGDEEIDESEDDDAASGFLVDDANQDALDVDGPGWKRNQPKTQPLTYAVPTDLDGGVEYRAIQFDVDFTDGESVERANKARRQGSLRAAKKLGLPPKRPSTKGREYNAVNNAWIMARYDSYAAANNNRRITMRQLVDEHNQRFSAEDRSQSSLATHVARTDHLRNKKGQYDP